MTELIKNETGTTVHLSIRTAGNDTSYSKVYSHESKNQNSTKASIQVNTVNIMFKVYFFKLSRLKKPTQIHNKNSLEF